MAPFDRDIVTCSCASDYHVPDTGTGYCFQAISLFVSFFVSMSARLRENGWTDWHEISGKVWSDRGTTWLHLWSIPRNRAMPGCATRGRGLLCFLTTACLFLCFFDSKTRLTRKRLDRFAWNFHGRCGVTMGQPDSILGQFEKNRAMPRC